MRTGRFILIVGTAALIGVWIFTVRAGPLPGQTAPDKGAEIDKLFARWAAPETPGGSSTFREKCWAGWPELSAYQDGNRIRPDSRDPAETAPGIT